MWPAGGSSQADCSTVSPLFLYMSQSPLSLFWGDCVRVQIKFRISAGIFCLWSNMNFWFFFVLISLCFEARKPINLVSVTQCWVPYPPLSSQSQTWVLSWENKILPSNTPPTAHELLLVCWFILVAELIKKSTCHNILKNSAMELQNESSTKTQKFNAGKGSMSCFRTKATSGCRVLPWAEGLKIDFDDHFNWLMRELSLFVCFKNYILWKLL